MANPIKAVKTKVAENRAAWKASGDRLEQLKRDHPDNFKRKGR